MKLIKTFFGILALVILVFAWVIRTIESSSKNEYIWNIVISRGIQK